MSPVAASHVNNACTTYVGLSKKSAGASPRAALAHSTAAPRAAWKMRGVVSSPRAARCSLGDFAVSGGSSKAGRRVTFSHCLDLVARDNSAHACFNLGRSAYVRCRSSSIPGGSAEWTDTNKPEVETVQVVADVDAVERVDTHPGSANGAKWELVVKVMYVAVASAVALKLALGFFPAGLGAPPATPPLQRVGELCVLASGALLGALNFGPQAGKQIHGGLRALDQIGGTRADAAEFLGLVMLKIIFDLFGLIVLAVPDAMLPGWLPRTAGIVVTMLAHGSFVTRCHITFNRDGTRKQIPPKARELISTADRVLAFLAMAVTIGTARNLPLVSLPTGCLFLIAAFYFTFENKKGPTKTSKKPTAVAPG